MAPLPRPARSRVSVPFFAATRRAFTLIELLTVIAIIGIPAAILIPTVGRVRETAKSAQCSSGMRQIAMGLFLYAEDNKGTFPPSKGVQPGGTSEVQWTKWIGSYLPKQGSSETAREHPLFVCQSTAYPTFTNDQLARSYTSSAVLMGPNAAGVQGKSSTTPRKIGTIAERTRSPLLVEGKQYGTGNGSLSTAAWTSVSGDVAATNPSATTTFDLRHGGLNRMNVAFADGSVRGQTLTDTALYTQELWEGR